MYSINETELVLQCMSQFDVVVDSLWFTNCSESIHAFDEWLNLSLDSATEVRATVDDLWER